MAQNNDGTKKLKICLIHPGVRSYRVKLFDDLFHKYDITYILTAGKRMNQYRKEWEEPIKKWKIKIIEDVPMVGYQRFSPGIFKELKKYDLIIASDSTSFPTHAAFLWGKLVLKKKLILWNELWTYPKIFTARLIKPFISIMTQKADACIAAGTKARNLYKELGADPHRITIAPNCAVEFDDNYKNDKHVEDLRERFGLKGKKVFLYVGRILPYKGLDNLIKAFSIIEKKFPQAFLLVGGPSVGRFEDECKQLAKKLGVKNIKFIGPIPHENVANYYLLCDMFVLPTRFLWNSVVPSEAWGLTINEVMSLGRPVITTTAVAAGYDMIHQGKNGYIVKEGNVKALSKVMGDFLSDKKKAKQMGAEAKKTVKDEFNYDKMAEGFHEAIRIATRLKDD
jgi:glycosyltransferase involved in cell wall biosynthesis